MSRKTLIVLINMSLLFFAVSIGFSGYHHMGEKDTAEFLKVYPDKKDTKLDSCALCHAGGEYKSSSNIMINMGSCQWCHYKYGYDGKGDIKDTLNSYGHDYLSSGRNSDSISAIALKDSDGDGYNNKTEIDAVRFPGNKEDDPEKKAAPSRVYTRAQLGSLPQHKQFLLMNADKSEDYYAEYKGVTLETLLKDAGILNGATGIRIYSPDGWSQYHPLYPGTDPALYHVFGDYPSALYHYEKQADKANGGWCDYSAPSAKGYRNKSPINVSRGLRLLLAYSRDGKNLDPGALSSTNRLEGEGPYRIIVPQKTLNPPDQGSTARNQDVTWPYNDNWDHNAGSSTRTATIIKVEPLPEGTTDIEIIEAGWEYVDEGKIIIYGAIKGSKDERIIKMSTTTSTVDSGILDVLLPEFTRDTGIEVKVIAKGTGAAIRDGMDGNVDIIFVHEKDKEERFISEGYGSYRLAVMHNDFIIIGPKGDPVGIKGVKSPAEALRKIAGSGAKFVSRGDDSGTHAKEQALWRHAGLTLKTETVEITKDGKKTGLSFVYPEDSRDWYMSIGQGMGKVITYAEEKQAYTLADRGTYLKYKFGRKQGLDLEILCEGDPELHNPYGIIPVSPAGHPHAKFSQAERLALWLVSEKAQRLIAEYRIEGHQAFFPDAIPGILK